MLIETGEIAIFGAGPAGLSSARNLSKAGFGVTIFRPEIQRVPRSVYTTSFDAADFHFDLSMISPLSHFRVITKHGVDFRVVTPAGLYFMLDNQGFVDKTEEDLKSQGVKVVKLPMKTLRGVQVNEQIDGVLIQVDGTGQKFDLVIDCTGVDAAIVKKVDPLRQQEDFLVEYVYGGAFKGEMSLDELAIVVGPAGGTSWVCPSILPGFVDVVYSAWGPASKYNSLFLTTAKQRLARLQKFLQNLDGINITTDSAEEIYCGMIRSHPAPDSFLKRTFSVGESAGMARPMTGDSFRFTLKGGELLAQAVKKDIDASRFQREWQRIWRSDIFFSWALARLPDQQNGDLGRKEQYLSSLVANEHLVKDAEDLIIMGKIHPRLIFSLMRDPYIRSFLANLFLKRGEIFIKGSNGVSIPWTLPEVN